MYRYMYICVDVCIYMYRCTQLYVRISVDSSGAAGGEASRAASHAEHQKGYAEGEDRDPIKRCRGKAGHGVCDLNILVT